MLLSFLFEHLVYECTMFTLQYKLPSDFLDFSRTKVMSVHSVDHIGPPSANDGYRGYDIDPNGQVVEFYDHTNDLNLSTPAGTSGISGSRRLLAEEPTATKAERHMSRRDLRETAGCCSCCVDILITISQLPLGSMICFILMWIGTALFIGAGWVLLDNTLHLFELYGPSVHNGNPALDPAPEYIPVRQGSQYELRDPRNPGNRVPEVFLNIQRSFYGIIPFMVLFSFVVVIDGAVSTTEITSGRRGCKTSSSGICCSVFVIALTYVLLLAWVFFLAFATLGVYYYRIVMLRCDDLQNSLFSEGEKENICVDLVQLGLVMFRSTTDGYFGKLCGPITTSRSVGDLQSYCQNYGHAWYLMLVCWSGLLINIIAMMHVLIIASSNYRAIQVKFSQRQRSHATNRSPAMSHRTATTNLSSAPSRPPYIVGTKANGDNR